MKLLFMGTPDFALFSLKALMQAGEDVIGVVTQPDKPRGRGYELTPPPVKRFAQTAGLPVWQPGTLRGEAFASLLDTLAPELIVVVAYGKILPGNVLTYPRYGCINVHGSLLPAYRGAAPMQRAILDGCTVTGVTTMYMERFPSAKMIPSKTFTTGWVRSGPIFSCVHCRSSGQERWSGRRRTDLWPPMRQKSKSKTVFWTSPAPRGSCIIRSAVCLPFRWPLPPRRTAAG